MDKENIYRSNILFFVYLTAVLLTNCGSKPAAAPPRPTTWTIGYWVWGLGEPVKIEQPVDVLFLQAGTIWPDGTRIDLPQNPPVAREYWLTLRAERGLSGLPAVTQLAKSLDDLRSRARAQHLNPVGVQLDIDSPTGSLKEYAKFLAEVRQTLPPGMQLSITALLDWFHDGTGIDAVIAQVDEFVPQFYDLGSPYSDEFIAAPIDAEKWAPRFNRLQKRYRIGISAFGRTRSPESGHLYRGLAPYDIADRMASLQDVRRSAAQELILTTKGPDPVQFIVPTPESVRAAVDSAKKFGGYSAGVVFFRWPNENETLVMRPEDVLAAAGFDIRPAEVGVESQSGGCVAVECYDLALLRANRFVPHPVEFHVSSSEDIDYLVPPEYGDVPARISGRRQIALKMWPYAAKARIELGRVVTAKPATFTLETQ
ncbi:MAG: DUF3142 domain-containing protein [Acidobacteriota bacterium]